MGQVLRMPEMTVRAYARYRRAQGLSGGSPGGVIKAISSGRIARGADGLIDSDAADEAWLRNTDAAKLRVPEQKLPDRAGVDHTQSEFRRGAGWLAHQLCISARRIWPAVVQEGWPGLSRHIQLGFIALLCERLEVWTASARAGTPGLPGFEWVALFGDDALSARMEYEELCKGLPTVGVEVEVSAASGDFSQGAKSYAGAICVAVRQRFPRLVDCEVFGPGGGGSWTVHLVGMLLALVEGWLATYVVTEWLPPLDWSGIDAGDLKQVEEQYRELRRQLAG